MDLNLNTNFNVNNNFFNIKPLLAFNSQNEIFNSLKLVENAYWDYIDNYNKENPKLYPYYKFVNFLQEMMVNTHEDHYHLAPIYVKKYNKYKKSIATDGVIMYNLTLKLTLTLTLTLNIIVVKISNTKIWSMPKGKREENETSLECAIREFSEETGIDVSETINDIDTETVSILKTIFFIQHADWLVDLNDYKTNEISHVKWVSTCEIKSNRDLYSKQTFFVAEFMDKFKV